MEATEFKIERSLRKAGGPVTQHAWGQTDLGPKQGEKRNIKYCEDTKMLCMYVT